MAMSDCVKCWDTPCKCGWDYRDYTKEARIRQAAAVLGLAADKLGGLLGDAVPVSHPMKSVPNKGIARK